MYTSDLAEKLLTQIITPYFLESVERWARYTGERFDIGDADVYVENMGEFKQTTKIPDIDWTDGKMTNKGEKDYHTFYDVTMIRNSSRCTDYNKIVIVAQRYPEYFTDKDKAERPAEIFIYAVFEDEYGIKPDNGQYTKFPSFERLKEDFESKKYCQYNSLIRNFCGRYTLATYNDCSDRIFSITAIASDLEWLNDDEDSEAIAKSISVPQRLDNITDVERGFLIKIKNNSDTITLDEPIILYADPAEVQHITQIKNDKVVVSYVEYGQEYKTDEIDIEKLPTKIKDEIEKVLTKL